MELAVGKSPMSREAPMALAWMSSAPNFPWNRSWTPCHRKGTAFQIVMAVRSGMGSSRRLRPRRSSMPMILPLYSSLVARAEMAGRLTLACSFSGRVSSQSSSVFASWRQRMETWPHRARTWTLITSRRSSSA